VKDKINELEANSKNKNIRGLYRGINKFRTYYKSVTNLVEDENGVTLAYYHSILNRHKNYL
jgi:hypothetical protein